MKQAMSRDAKRLALAAMAFAAAPGLALASMPAGASADVPESTSANWAGYVASAPSGGSQQFSSVSASWVEPSADCSSATGDAAYWVGLGGASQGSGALEQVGTEVDCSAGGNGTHFAWYELVPAGPVKLDVAISPGDKIYARVAVAGSNVTVSLTDHTTGATSTQTLQMNNPDASSAEWIAEAPSACQGGDASDVSNCTPVSLADFGTVTFTGAAATANGATDTISSPNWDAQAVQLSGSSSAAPSSLSSDGSSFSVTSQASGSGADPYSSGYGDPGTGYVDPGTGYGDPGTGYVDPGSGYGNAGSAYGDSGSGYGYGGGWTDPYSGYGLGYSFGPLG
jgi:hypothetical protein